MAKDNIELKAQNENLQTKIQESQEKCEENLKILCKAKKNTDNVEQQVISLKRVNLELETTIHSLEKYQASRKSESSRRIEENKSQTLHLNDNNLSNTKKFEPVPQSKDVPCLPAKEKSLENMGKEKT